MPYERISLRPGNHIIAIFLLLLMAACTRPARKPVECPGNPATMKALEVHPLYQAAFGNGPASLTMVLNFHGVDISLEEVTADLLSDSLDETPIEQMEAYARKFFPQSRVRKSSLCEVIDSISKGNPVILLIDRGRPHMSVTQYIVAFGYDLSLAELVFHNGYSENNKALFEVIEKNWEKTGFLSMYIDGY